MPNIERTGTLTVYVPEPERHHLVSQHPVKGRARTLEAAEVRLYYAINATDAQWQCWRADVRGPLLNDNGAHGSNYDHPQPGNAPQWLCTLAEAHRPRLTQEGTTPT